MSNPLFSFCYKNYIYDLFHILLLEFMFNSLDHLNVSKYLQRFEIFFKRNFSKKKVLID